MAVQSVKELTVYKKAYRQDAGINDRTSLEVLADP
jgi:hypothetical protein